MNFCVPPPPNLVHTPALLKLLINTVYMLVHVGKNLANQNVSARPFVDKVAYPGVVALDKR